MGEDLSGCTVLVVDDVVENLRVVSTLLQCAGLVPRPVRSGGLALKAALAAPPDLILLDIAMPEIDGLEVCRRLGGRAPQGRARRLGGQPPSWKPRPSARSGMLSHP